MSPNVADTFSPSALSLTLEKSAWSLMQVLIYWVPRIGSDVTFQISLRHTYLFQCVPRSGCLTKRKCTLRADWLLPCNFEWHETCNFGN
jgi:hypothetical protein